MAPRGAFLSAFSDLDLNESISNGDFNTTSGNHSSLVDLIVNHSHQLFRLSLFSAISSQVFSLTALNCPFGTHSSLVPTS